MSSTARNKLPHQIPQWVPEGSWFFITINCTPRRQNQLCYDQVGNEVLAAMAYYHDAHIWNCRLALLMPDHLHAILAFPRGRGMKTTIDTWKKYVASSLSVRWQRDFFDHRLRTGQQLQEKISYIINNPERSNLCKPGEIWKWIYRPSDRPPIIL